MNSHLLSWGGRCNLSDRKAAEEQECAVLITGKRQFLSFRKAQISGTEYSLLYTLLRDNLR